MLSWAALGQCPVGLCLVMASQEIRLLAYAGMALTSERCVRCKPSPGANNSLMHRSTSPRAKDYVVRNLMSL